MPLYEYQCDTCAHRFEVLQKRADAPIEICPSCAGPVHKLQSAPAFQFKGTGWYVTDYPKKDQSSSKGDADSKDGGKSSADTSEKADKSDKSDKTDSKSAEGSKSTSSSDSSTSSSTTSPPSSTKS